MKVTALNFSTRVRDDLLLFALEWMRRHEQAPELYPEKMPLVEWWKHFRLFMEGDRPGSLG